MPVFDDAPERELLRPVLSGTWAVRIGENELSTLALLMTGVGDGPDASRPVYFMHQLLAEAYRCSDEDEMAPPYRLRVTLEVDHAD